MKKAKHIFSSIIAAVALMGSGLFAQVGPEPITEANEGVPFYVILAQNQEDSKVSPEKAREELNKLIFWFNKFATEEPNNVMINEIVQMGTVKEDSQIWVFYEKAHSAHALFGSSAWIEGDVGQEFPLLANTKIKDKFDVKVKRSIQTRRDGKKIIVFMIMVAVLK